jgi:radical SAM superfamily enzyme YgiQ (UPF0313 family)
MRVKMVLPRKTAFDNRLWRPIKYSLFPPLGLASLAAFLDDADEVTIEDEHVQDVDLDDDPDLVVIEVYTSSAQRAYALADRYRARGAYVCLGGLHVTAVPDEAARHADTVFIGPGEDTWPAFLADRRAGRSGAVYRSTRRTLDDAPPPRRDLFRRELYLVPNSIVVSRGCPHSCDFCYKESFFAGGKSFYVQPVDKALAEIERLPGRHLYFLDDNLFGNPQFADTLFECMRGMGRVWQAAGTVQAVLRPGLLERAVDAGLRSLFVGFETLDPDNLRAQHKPQNLPDRFATTLAPRQHGDGFRRPAHPYELVIRRLHDLGVMVNASFVFGMDQDDPSVFDRTVEWALRQGAATATFHILTPYPGTALHRRLDREGRITSRDWNKYDTRHAVFEPAGMTRSELEAGYLRAYRDFYSWRGMLTASRAHQSSRERLRHAAYTAGWKKMEPLWDVAIRHGRVHRLLPLLETILAGSAERGASTMPDLRSRLRRERPHVSSRSRPTAVGRHA